MTLASLGSRFLAQLIDNVIGVLPIIAGFIFVANNEGALAIWLLASLVWLLFYVLFNDGFANGQSYGKKMLEIRVVDAATGKPCTYMQSFIRNVILSVLGPIDLIFMLGDSRRRLGDRAAGTSVVQA